MSLETILCFGIIAIVVLAVIFFPSELKALFKGFLRIFIKDIATTPEGAEALFSEKIDEAQRSYNVASNAYKSASGKLSLAKRDMENLKARLTKVEAECESLVKNGKVDLAQLKAEEREEILADIKRHTTIITAYEDATKKAKAAQELCEKNLRTLKRESRETIENMKVKAELQNVYENMDELGNTTGTDKLLDAVREKNKELDAIVEGSRVAHDNKLSTRLQNVEREVHKLQSNDYLESLKKKYNK